MGNLWNCIILDTKVKDGKKVCSIKNKDGNITYFDDIPEESLDDFIRDIEIKAKKQGKTANEYLDELTHSSFDDEINAKDFKFRKLGYKFAHDFFIAKDGVKEITHYLINRNGEKLWQGMSTITKDGVLFNMFDVSIQQQEVSTAMYKLLDKIKFEKIEASYGSGALGTNYAEFMNVYQVSKNPIEAALATPAGKALNKALDGKFKPVDIVITDHKVKLFWIKK